MTFGLSSRGPPSVDQTEFSEVQGPALDRGGSTAGVLAVYPLCLLSGSPV